MLHDITDDAKNAIEWMYEIGVEAPQPDPSGRSTTHEWCGM